MKNYKNIVIAAIAAISAITLAGCANDERNDYSANTAPASSEQPVSSSVASTSVTTEKPVFTAPSSSKPVFTAPSSSKPVFTAPSSSKPASSSRSSSKPASKPAFSSKSSSKPASSEPTVYAQDNSVAAISKICGLKSTVEKNEAACAVDVFEDHNPYDVVYDYGRVYDKYVGKCDWSLVFDADYYIKQFPLLAMQYHDDEDLLLEHFQTVGVHEGRQGSAKFNVGAYKANCDSKIRDAFGDNYEGYYFYYMMNPSEKSVDATSGTNLKNQYKSVMTALQSAELDGINMYRAEVGAAPLVFNGELAAYANFRAWTNVHDGWEAHDWVHANRETVYSVGRQLHSSCISENVAYASRYQSHGQTFYLVYRNSPAHYQGMINELYDATGTSNVYSRNRDYSKTYQCDAFIDAA